MLVGGDVRMGEVCSRFHVGGESVLLDCGARADVVLGAADEGNGVMIVVMGIDGGVGRSLWRELLGRGEVVATFDLYDVGVAFVGVGATRGRYVVNW